jgi:hypothetical protein
MSLVECCFACESGSIIGITMANNDSGADMDQPVNQQLSLDISSALQLSQRNVQQQLEPQRQSPRTRPKSLDLGSAREL